MALSCFALPSLFLRSRFGGPSLFSLIGRSESPKEHRTQSELHFCGHLLSDDHLPAILEIESLVGRSYLATREVEDDVGIRLAASSFVSDGAALYACVTIVR